MKNRKAPLAIALALVMLLSLGACAKTADPNLGIYEGVLIDVFDDGHAVPMEDFYDDDSSIELKSGGKGNLILDGDSTDIKWTLSGSELTIKADGLEYTGTLKKEVIVIDIFTMIFTFAKKGAKIPSAKPADDDDDDDDIKDGKTALGLTAAQEMWNGTWYGFLWIGDAFGEYAEFTNEMFDATMVLEIEADGQGTLSIFRDGQEDATAHATITADESHFEIVEGLFWDMPLDPIDWFGGLAPGVDGKYMVMDSEYIDPELTEDDKFEYSFHFRPYGETWDSEQSRLPPGYDNYLQALADGNNPVQSSPSSSTPSGSSAGLSNKLDTQWATVYYPDTVEETPDKYSPSKMTLIDKKGRFIMSYVDNGWGMASEAAGSSKDAFENDSAGDLYIEKTTIDGVESWIVAYTGDSMGPTVEVYIQYTDDDCLRLDFTHPEFSGTLADFQAIPEIWAIIDSIDLK